MADHIHKRETFGNWFKSAFTSFSWSIIYLFEFGIILLIAAILVHNTMLVDRKIARMLYTRSKSRETAQASAGGGEEGYREVEGPDGEGTNVASSQAEWPAEATDVGTVIASVTGLGHIIAVLSYWRHFSFLKVLACSTAGFMLFSFVLVAVNAATVMVRSFVSREVKDAEYIRLEPMDSESRFQKLKRYQSYFLDR
jgi:hypothetical protein